MNEERRDSTKAGIQKSSYSHYYCAATYGSAVCSYQAGSAPRPTLPMVAMR